MIFANALRLLAVLLVAIGLAMALAYGGVLATSDADTLRDFWLYAALTAGLPALVTLVAWDIFGKRDDRIQRVGWVILGVGFRLTVTPLAALVGFLVEPRVKIDPLPFFLGLIAFHLVMLIAETVIQLRSLRVAASS